MITRSINLLASSDTDAGAENVSSDGSQFSITLSNPIQIPRNAINPRVSVEKATIWWTILNIEEGVNDTFYVNHSSTDYTVTIEPGLYDITGLNTALTRGLNNEEFTSTITLTGDNNTQKSILTIADTAVTVDFTQSDTFRELLGFDSQTIVSTVADESFTSDNVANFSSIGSFLIHSDLTDKGIIINNRYSQAVAQVLIDVSPGSQIVYEPYRPSTTAAKMLAGSLKQNIRFWLTDQNGNAVNTNEESWTALMRIQYEEKV